MARGSADTGAIGSTIATTRLAGASPTRTMTQSTSRPRSLIGRTVIPLGPDWPARDTVPSRSARQAFSGLSDAPLAEPWRR